MAAGLHVTYLDKQSVIQLKVIKDFPHVQPYLITHCFRSQNTDSATKLSQLRSFQLKKGIPSTFHSIKLNSPLLANDQMQIANNTTRKADHRNGNSELRHRSERHLAVAVWRFEQPNQTMRVVSTHLPRRDWSRNHHLQPQESFQSAKKDLNERRCRRIVIENWKSRKRTRDEGEETEAPDLVREARQRVIINSRERKGNPRERERDLRRGVCLKNRENVGGGVSLSVVEDLELRRTPFLFSL